MGIKRYDRKYLTKVKYQKLLTRHRHTIKEINERVNKEILDPNTYLYTLEDIAKINEYLAKAVWKECCKSSGNRKRWLWERIIDIYKDSIKKPFG